MTGETIVGDLYARYAAGVRKHLVWLVGEVDVDDLMHDVFEKAQRGLGTFRTDARLSTWLFRIATYAAIDSLKSRSVRERHASAEPFDDAEFPADDVRADDALAHTQMRACVRRLVDRLPANQKAILVLADLRGMSDQEAAEALGISIGTAKMRLHRARLALRHLMTCECDVYHDEQNDLGCEPKLHGPSH